MRVFLFLRAQGYRWAVGLLSVLGVAGVVIYGIANSLSTKHDVQIVMREVRGIDVSSHQKEIVWRDVKGDDVHFVYMKATEGNDFVDPKFRTYWRGARQVGLSVGAYHFFTLCSPGIEQAENFLRTTSAEMKRTNQTFIFPFAIDAEFTPGCKNRPNGEKVRAEMDAFMQRVEKAIGQRALLYVSPEFEKQYATKTWFDRERWEVNLTTRPANPWRIWQYSHEGKVKGIKTDVDLNFRKS